jgi:ACS family glucarate transporter-like MFS transporter
MTGQVKTRWNLVALLSATATASYLSRVNVSVAGVMMRDEFGLSQEALGALFSAFTFSYALFQIPGGMLVDRFGAKRVLAVATLCWVVCTGVLAAARNTAMIFVGRLLLGVFEAPTFPSSGQAVGRWLPASLHGRANGFVIAAVGFGSAIAPPLITSIMVPYGWRTALMISAIPPLLLSILWMRFRTPPEEEAVTKEAGHGTMKSLSFILLTISYTLQGYVGYIFVFWFYTYLVDVRHFDLMRSAWLSSLPWLMSIVSIPAGGASSDWLVMRYGLKRGRRIVPIIGFTLSAAFLSIGAHTSNPYVAAVSLAFATAFILCAEGTYWATMSELSGSNSGAAGGVMNCGSNIGGFISPALTPVIATAFGWENALHTASAVSIAAGVLWFAIDASEKPC